MPPFRRRTPPEAFFFQRESLHETYETYRILLYHHLPRTDGGLTQSLETKLRGDEYFTNAGTAVDPPVTLSAVRVYSDLAGRELLLSQVPALPNPSPPCPPRGPPRPSALLSMARLQLRRSPPTMQSAGNP